MRSIAPPFATTGEPQNGSWIVDSIHGAQLDSESRELESVQRNSHCAATFARDELARVTGRLTGDFMARLTLYHGSPSRSSIVLWMLEELGEPYDVHVLSFVKGENRAPG